MKDKHSRGDEAPCPHNSSVFCSARERRCATCGWNPPVDRRRHEKVREEHTHVARGY